MRRAARQGLSGGKNTEVSHVSWHYNLIHAKVTFLQLRGRPRAGAGPGDKHVVGACDELHIAYWRCLNEKLGKSQFIPPKKKATRRVKIVNGWYLDVHVPPRTNLEI